jgi:hypothetical protein
MAEQVTVSLTLAAWYRRIVRRPCLSLGTTGWKLSKVNSIQRERGDYLGEQIINVLGRPFLRGNLNFLLKPYPLLLRMLPRRVVIPIQSVTRFSRFQEVLRKVRVPAQVLQLRLLPLLLVNPKYGLTSWARLQLDGRFVVDGASGVVAHVNPDGDVFERAAQMARRCVSITTHRLRRQKAERRGHEHEHELHPLQSLLLPLNLFLAKRVLQFLHVSRVPGAG